VALAFVLDFDELLFSTLEPLPAQALVGQTERLPLKRPWHWRGLGVKPIAFVSITLTFVLAMHGTYVSETQDKMTQLNSTLCGGDQDFAYEMNQYLGFMALANTTPFRHIFPEEFSGEVKVAHQYAWREAVNMTTQAYSEQPLSFLHEIRGITAEGATVGMDCKDSPSLLGKWEELVRHATSDYTAAATCSGFAAHCERTDAAMVRALCPVTCGCASPRSGARSTLGCPVRCRIVEPYLSEFLALRCADPPDAELAADPGFRRLRRSMGLSAEFRSCSWLRGRGARHCDPPEVTEEGSFRYFCPGACGCGPGVPYCPPSCGGR